jgi:hypothetical protein
LRTDFVLDHPWPLTTLVCFNMLRNVKKRKKEYQDDGDEENNGHKDGHSTFLIETEMKRIRISYTPGELRYAVYSVYLCALIAIC